MRIKLFIITSHDKNQGVALNRDTSIPEIPEIPEIPSIPKIPDMTTKQLSVFLENKTGRLNDVTKVLSAAGVNMRAFSVADNSDFGILRLLVDDIDKAKQVLKESGFAVSVTDVIALNIDNHAGSLGKVLDILEASNCYIDYMYAFSDGDTANVAIKADNMEVAIKALQSNNITTI